MTTPITKEQLIARIVALMDLEIANLALASLEAEPVGTFRKGPCGYSPSFHEDAVQLYAAPPAPASVPDEVCWEDVPEEITEDDMALASAWAHGFNQCRAAMLQGADGNSPAIPDGWQLVPVEPTTNQWAAGMQAFDSGVDKVTRVYKAMLAAAPQQEGSDG